MDYEEKLEWLDGMTLDEVLERYDMVQAIPPSGIKLHCNNEADIEGIINDLSLLFKNRYEEYLNNLYVKASSI